jgi:two-component system chemotaxis sensor kinase CheA
VKNAKSNIEEGILMMVEGKNKTVCLLVDELLGEQQVVVKTLPKYIRRMKKNTRAGWLYPAGKWGHQPDFGY